MEPADYDGDGRTDVAVYRASEGLWIILQSSNSEVIYIEFGLSTDTPVPGDYDGDGKADQAVYRPAEGVWYLNQSSSGFGAAQFGVLTDIPIPAAYLP